ncbi:MAG: protein-methionine-sulfoxide reductase heme-binding subunit MsrQ [Maricaulaceae bacterium]|jgi:sulfoxide reductase heme-binding subunit YedZ
MALTLKQFGRVWLKPIAFWVLFAPFAWLAWQWIALFAGWPNAMGFNVEEYTHRYLGDTAIRVLLAALAVTPFRDLTGWPQIMMIRRRIGLFAFAYAFLHIGFYLAVTLRFSLPALWDDVTERIYITFGMAAFLGLIPLAITSHNAMIRRLGAVKWQRLHWLVYPIAIAAVTHHAFMVKVNQSGPWVHGIILAALLGWRIAKRFGLVHPRTKARAKATSA